MDVLFAENFIQSMQLDGFHSSHAISTPVEDPAQIGSIFDAISYQKVGIFSSKFQKMGM
jgi:aminopeptidase N